MVVIWYFVSKISGGGVISDVENMRLSYLESDTLGELMEAVYRANSLEGDIVETGCALGGSSICIASEKISSKKFFVYDVFGMIPQPGEKDGADVLERYRVIREGKSQGIGGDMYYGYQDDLLQVVKDNFRKILGMSDLEANKIWLVKGLFQDTLKCNDPIALAHIDCDWYDSVKVCLEHIVPKLVVGGILIIDDYYHWSGAREAVDDYFRDKKELFMFDKKRRLHITKK